MGVAASPAVALRAGDLAVEVAAGALLEVVSLRDHGGELLVGAAELPAAATVHGRAAGITFLHPWANRVGADAYTAGGVTGTLAAGEGRLSRDEHGVALHGLTAPPGAWRLETAGPARGAPPPRPPRGAGAPVPLPPPPPGGGGAGGRGAGGNTPPPAARSPPGPPPARRGPPPPP